MLLDWETEPRRFGPTGPGCTQRIPCGGGPGSPQTVSRI